MKKYIKVAENPKQITHLKIEVYYSLGGYNVLTYKQEARGYYAAVSPVTRGNGVESYTMFSGVKKLVKPVSRRSQKAEEAAELLAEGMLGDLINYVCDSNGLTAATYTEATD